MADHQSGSSPSTPIAQDKRFFSRSGLPYLMAAVMASAAMAWYFFLFVPAKLDYFLGLRFRALAVASGHVDSMAENLARGFGSLPECDAEDTAADLQTRDREKHGAVLEANRSYVRHVLPQIQLSPQASGLHLKACALDGTVGWTDLVAQAAAASREEFDDLILANGDGGVVWQRETTTPRIGNLSELLGAEDEAGGFSPFIWRIRATEPVKSDSTHLRSTAILKAVNLGGVSSLLLTQAIALDSPLIVHASQDAPRTLYLAGLVSRGGLQREAMQIPIAWLLIMALPVVLVVLALPFVKLATLTAKERYSRVDLVAMIVVTVAIAGLGAMVPFVSGRLTAADTTLKTFADTLEQRWLEETQDVLHLAGAIVSKETQIRNSLGDCAVPTELDGNVTAQRCQLWQALEQAQARQRGASLELDVVIWFDRNGEQKQKWTTKAQITGKTSHRPLAHYRDVIEGRLWTLTPDGSAPSDPQRRFTIDTLRAPTTAELGVVFALPLAEFSGARTDSADQYLALNVRPQSLVDTIVPPGYGFALLAPDGRVLFHSVEDLSLEENFFEEVGDPGTVRQLARSGRLVRWSGDYHGRPHRFLMQPVRQFRGNPWLIVTFQEREPVLAAEALHQSATIRLVALNLLFLSLIAACLAIFAKTKHRRVRDLAPALLAASPEGGHWLWVLLGLAVFEMGLITFTYGAPAAQWSDWLYGWFVVLPALAFLITVLVRRRGSDTHAWSATHWQVRVPHWLIAAELGLLVLIMGALPAIGFARVVHLVQSTQQTERWLESVDDRWLDRVNEVTRRVNSPNYEGGTRSELVRKGFAAEPEVLDKTTRFSYLNVAVPFTARQEGGGRAEVYVPVSRGQGLVRAIMAWTPFASHDEPGRAVTERSTSTHAIRLRPGTAGPALAGIAVTPPETSVDPGIVVLGVLILAGAVWAGYWARRKLLPPLRESAIDLAKAIRNAPTDRSVAVMLIGPPRIKKDAALEHAVEQATGKGPVVCVRLLNATLSEAFITKQADIVARAIEKRDPAARGPAWIHVSHLESQLADETSRGLVVRLLERLLQGTPGRPRALAVTTNVDPVAHFKELFSTERRDIYADLAPEVSLSRSALVLSRFERCYMPIGGRANHDAHDAYCRQSWVAWWQYEASNWKHTLSQELDDYRPLRQIRQQLEESWAGRTHVPFDEMANAIRTKAAATYELLWASCTRSEKLVLVQLAQEGFVAAQSRNAVAPLIAKGIVVERPVLGVFNHTFRDFLLDIERSRVIQEWERMEGNGVWVVAGRLIGGSLALGGVFYLLTQDPSVRSLLPILSGTGLFGAPLFRTVFARLSGQKEGTAV